MYIPPYESEPVKHINVFCEPSLKVRVKKIAKNNVVSVSKTCIHILRTNLDVNASDVEVKRRSRKGTAILSILLPLDLAAEIDRVMGLHGLSQNELCLTVIERALANAGL